MPTQLFEPRKEIRPTAPPARPRADLGRRLDRLMDTTSEVHLAACRLILGGVMIPHALQKVFGAFGGQGIAGTIRGFHDHLGIPAAVGALVIAAEFLGALSLILGFLGRIGASCIIAVMVGAIVLVHAPNGFFMNWMGKQPGEGFEYHLLAIGLAIPVLARGSGAGSLDLALVRWLRRDRTDAA